VTTLSDTATARRTAPARPRASRATDVVMLVLATWLVGGAFVDAWAHANLAELETFFTPWHAVLYSGYAACAAWISWQVVRAQDRGGRGLAGVPVAYGLGLVGLAVFALGGAGDLLWHEVFGIETDIDALLSPTHLVLFGGTLLIVSIPLRSAWARPDGRDAGSLAAFLVPQLSLALVTAVVSFFFMYFSAFASDAPAQGDDGLIVGIAEALVTNLILVGALLFLLKRWQPPFGAVTILFGVVALLMTVIFAFTTVVTVIPALLGGLAADVLIRRLHPSVDRPAALQVVATAVPFVLWVAYYATFAVQGRLSWVPEIYSGLVVFNSLAGFALARLQLPVTVARA
jgi:hypothetical protein